MELSPEAIVGVEFGTVRKGYDPEEVRQFLMQVARGVEEMRTQLVTSDNRARAALAKLQEVSSQPARSVAPVAAPVSAPADQSADMETISRTLMVAQKTADNLVAEAQTQSAQIVSAAEERARAIVAEAERRSAERVAASENEARARGEAERVRVESEIEDLAARRARLHSESQRLDSHVSDQRKQVASAVDVLHRLLNEPSGLQPRPFNESGFAETVSASPASTTSTPSTTTAEPDTSGSLHGGDDLAGDLAGYSSRPSDRPSFADSPSTQAVPAVEPSPGAEESPADFFSQGVFEDDRWKPRRDRD